MSSSISSFPFIVIPSKLSISLKALALTLVHDGWSISWDIVDWNYVTVASPSTSRPMKGILEIVGSCKVNHLFSTPLLKYIFTKPSLGLYHIVSGLASGTVTDVFIFTKSFPSLVLYNLKYLY